jgi:hypothetical protein
MVIFVYDDASAYKALGWFNVEHGVVKFGEKLSRTSVQKLKARISGYGLPFPMELDKTHDNVLFESILPILQ